MATTAKYKLPLISGNMTADVVRDMNALATKTDEVIATLASASANKGKLDALTAEFAAHKAGIETEEGVHNLRYKNGVLEVKVGEKWQAVSTAPSSGTTTPPTDSEDGDGDIDTPTQQPPKPTNAVIYGVQIDTTNSDSEKALTYTDDAVNFTAATRDGFGVFSWGSWENVFPFNAIKPCLLRDNGTVNYYLSKDDFRYKEGGELANLDGTDGNVMIEFPKIYWKIERVGTKLNVQYSNTKVEGFECLAHKRGNTEKEKLYISAYLGYMRGNRLVSIHDFPVSNGQTITQFRTAAKANGANFDLMGYYQLLMLQILYVVMFKNTNSQYYFGSGRISTTGGLDRTGASTSYSMMYGSSDGINPVKFCGIEDIYGMVMYFIDGIRTGTNDFKIGTQNFADNASGYESIQVTPSTITAIERGYIKAVHGTTKLGFISSDRGYGSSSTYYADMGAAKVNSAAAFGGYKGSDNDAGIFALEINKNHATESSPNIGARIMYL